MLEGIFQYSQHTNTTQTTRYVQADLACQHTTEGWVGGGEVLGGGWEEARFLAGGKEKNNKLKNEIKIEKLLEDWHRLRN
jgi:hypothetical protein